MPISISNTSISTQAPVGATIGTLMIWDEIGTPRHADLSLSPSSAGFFALAGYTLVTIRGAIPPGYYSVSVSANARSIGMRLNAMFEIQVTTD